MRISDREIYTEENGGLITFESGAVTRLVIGQSGGITVSGALSASGAATIGSAGGTVGFFGATAVAVQATTATTGTFTAGTGTAAVSGSSWVGNVGTKSYSVSDIVTALKNYNLLTP